jgi:hypothetical protein
MFIYQTLINSYPAKLDPKELVTFEELRMAKTITQEAIINLLHEKALINKEEVLEEIKRLKKKQLKVTGL